ncbi:MAG: AAA family ATPase [Deltaproteobacteria bacterium]|nr:AAA family ATPase [Deltaproteobacteria bacterium]
MGCVGEHLPGIDVIFGGGIRTLERVPGAGESVSILLRGPPGSGKTLLGASLAAAMARSLGKDVAYGCVELLPVELAAQLEGLLPSSGSNAVHVVPLPAAERPLPEGLRVLAASLPLASPGEDQRQLLGPALVGLLAEARDAGARPGVLVVDSRRTATGSARPLPASWRTACASWRSQKVSARSCWRRLPAHPAPLGASPATWCWTSAPKPFDPGGA